MKINNLQFQQNKRKADKLLHVLKLTFYLLFMGLIQLHAGLDSTPVQTAFSDHSLVTNDQQVQVSGRITDAGNNEALAGVTVAVEGTTVGTLTGIDGKYTLSVPSSSSVLVFSYVGYETVKVPVTGQSTINVSLAAALLAIDEVVVVGYGTQKKATITGAVVSIGQVQLMQSPQANISNALVGRMPGLLSVQRSGQPGADASVLRIRGVGTFTGIQDPLIMVDGIETDNYNNIDPNEIESISILKDASATAVYGVRGANGVIIITTKRGREGKPQISYSTQYATSRFTGMLSGLSAYDYATGFNLAKKYDGFITGGYSPAYSDEAIAKYKSNEDPVFYPDVDWYNYMFNKSSGQMQHNLNINGGTDKVKYFVSLGYFTQEGLINNTNIVKDFDATPTYDRYNIRSNFDFEITKRLSAVVNLSTQIENRKGNSSFSRVFEACWAGNPVDHPLPEDVGNRFVNLDGALSQLSPLIFLLQSGYSKNYRNYLNSSVRFNYKLDYIIKGLSSHATISYNNYNSQNINYGKNFVQYKAKRLDDQTINYVPQSDPTPFGFSESFGKNRKVYFEAALDYSRKFGDHNVSGLLLYNQSKRYDPGLTFLVPNGYQGIVGRVTYDLKGKYLAELNIGYNGTENFAPDKRFGFFPAYSLGWVASEEQFFPKNNIITYLKFRGSYGVVGNDQIGGNRFLYRPAAYTYVNNIYQFGEYGSNQQGYQGSLEGALGNPDVTWERAKKMNIGAEMAFAKNKLKLAFDYFDENRDNILASKQTIPMIVAAILPAYNLGEMSNRGYEAEASYNGKIAKFNYWLKANFSYAHNKIEFQDEITKTFPYQYRTGQRYGQKFGLLADGLFNSWEEVNDANRPVYSYQNNKIQPGDIRYVDINGDGLINSDDAIPIGYSDFPEKIFGFSFGGDYKGFDLSILFQGATNVSVTYSRSYVQPFNEARTAPEFMLESWSQERLDNGQKISFPRFNQGLSSSTALHQSSSFWTVDASYVRLKNAELGYSIPQHILRKIHLDYLRLYINGSNLLTWSKLLPGLDPESAAASSVNSDPYPVTRTINFGLNVKF
jgi:TonB-linked SusC/RagA family outer membrane protein